MKNGKSKKGPLSSQKISVVMRKSPHVMTIFNPLIYMNRMHTCAVGEGDQCHCQ